MYRLLSYKGSVGKVSGITYLDYYYKVYLYFRG